MDQCEDRGTTLSGEQDRGTTLSGEQDRGTTLSGEQDRQTKAQSREQQHRHGPESEAEPSCVSIKRDRSTKPPLRFKASSTAETILRLDSDESEPEPEPSCVSMKSDRSIGHFIDFKEQHPSAAKRFDQESSAVPSGQSAQQHETHLDSIFKLLEDDIITFVKNELKKIQKFLSPDYPECLESQREDEEVLEGEDEEQRSSREAFLKITLHFMRRMKQDELADFLQCGSLAGVHKN
ncbi:hypothetical protein EPR50_G00093290 [Perca flavescens]|uniref:Uncharacterized protein n=1 Tax=Perca flavescens TaxID=8167 RepID=A0A484D444_PERFV|nr:hypothetical protein EPR50_G00093290 [Perca flavescens]